MAQKAGDVNINELAAYESDEDAPTLGGDVPGADGKRYYLVSVFETRLVAKEAPLALLLVYLLISL